MKQYKISILQFRNFLTAFGTVVTLILYIFQIGGILGGYFTTIISIIALCFVLYGLGSVISALGGGPKKPSFQLIFFGILSSQVGLILWTIFTLTGNLKSANTIPPLFYIATYFLNFIGFLRLGMVSQIKVRDFMGVIIGFGVLGLTILTIANASHPVTLNLISSGFLIGDVLRIIIIALLLQMVVIYQGGLLGRYWLSIFVGNMFIFIGNFAASILTSEYMSGRWPYPLIDLIFIGGYLFVAHGFYGIGDSIRFAQKQIREHRKK